MGEKPTDPDSLLTLPVALGVIVVLGGIAALVVSGLFVYRAQSVNAETERIQASLQAEREREASDEIENVSAQESAVAAPATGQLPGSIVEARQVPTSSSLDTGKSALKPGLRLQAQRPAHWDQAEIIDVLEDEMIKVRWLSGEPGEAVIAVDLVRSEDL